MKAAIKYISRIKCVRWLVSVLGYITNYLSLTRKARLRKTAIQKNHSIVKPFQKALYQRSNISFGKSKIVTKTDSIVSFIDSYEAEMVRPVKLANIQTTSNEPILLCVVKDDLRRVKAQLPHYRGIGVRHFAYIDNESTDGTFDLLREQDDVSLFSVSETYGASKQRAWYRQATDMLGYDRWYLVVDSDEFFVYPGIESIPITQYIDFLESKDIEAILAPMIDMYSDKRIFSDTHELDFRSEYSWFDTDTYVNYRLYHMQHIDGGPRYRISAGYVLSKYPLLKMKKSYLVGDHCNFPHRLNFQTKRAAAFLLHYKFLDEDYRAYLNYIESGVHANKSLDYKTNRKTYEQVRSNPDISFYYERSQKYTNSMDLLKINISDRAFFRELLDAQLGQLTIDN